MILSPTQATAAHTAPMPGSLMKAVVYTEYGSPDVLHLTFVPKPTPKKGEILIKVHAAAVGFGDLMVRRFGEVSPREFNMPLPMWLLGRLSFGFRKPRYGMLGHEFAGEVEAVGRGGRFKAGRVFGLLRRLDERRCRLRDHAWKRGGASCRTMRLSSGGGGSVWRVHRAQPVAQGEIPRRKVLIWAPPEESVLRRCSWPSTGAEVTGGRDARLGLLRGPRCDRHYYTVQDFTQDGKTYDLIFDVLGRSSFGRCRESLTPNGRYFLVSFKARDILDMLWTSLGSRKKVICGLAIPERKEDLLEVKALLEAGVLKAVIDRRFPLEQTAEAHRYIEGGHKKGHIVITMGNDAD
jgi:NADPH:quinone reductase-like Zn-dependent oxidoreductase